MSEVLFSTAWFGPVLYYALFKRADKIYIEGAENYIKQTYRNRCVIATSNGPMSLSLPVEGSEKAKINIKDVKLSNHGDWQRMHWYSIESAYNSSPYFEYYADDLKPFFEKTERWLFDFNEEIREKVCELIGIDRNCEVSETYLRDVIPVRADILKNLSDSVSGEITVEPEIGGLVDLRNVLQPKSNVITELGKDIIKPYYQVFDRKFGFIPNLSILDLLFNMGPETILYL